MTQSSLPAWGSRKKALWPTLSRCTSLKLHLVYPPRVSLKILRVLALNRVQLPACRSRGKQWGNKELAKDVQSALEGVLIDVKEVVCVLCVGVGIGGATVHAQKLLQGTFLRILLGPQEKHVLAKVGQSRYIGRIREVTHVDVESSRRFVRKGV